MTMLFERGRLVPLTFRRPVVLGVTFISKEDGTQAHNIDSHRPPT